MLWTLVIFHVASAAIALRLPLEIFQEGEVHRAPVSLIRRSDRGALKKAQHHQQQQQQFKTIYQSGTSEEDLPVCSPRAVCNKVDMYDENQPWIERQCRCAGHHACKSNLATDDGHTLIDRTRHYKLCEPLKKLPKCRYFRDPTWTLISNPQANATEQIVHCHCPKNSVTYLQNKQTFETSSGHVGYQYSFACSPQNRLRCSRKEPCRMFTVRKRQDVFEEVNTSVLCQCPRSFTCPRRHTSIGVLPGKTYAEDSIRTYSGYCMPASIPVPESIQKSK